MRDLYASGQEDHRLTGRERQAGKLVSRGGNLPSLPTPLGTPRRWWDQPGHRAGWESEGRRPQARAGWSCCATEAPPKSALLTAPRVFLSAPAATEFGEPVRTLRSPPPWLAQPCSWSPPPRHLSDSRMGARPTRKGLGEGAPLVSTCDGELNFSFTRCRGNAGGGDEWAGRGALRVNQLRRRPRGVPALARRCLGSAQRAGASLPRPRKVQPLSG